LLDLFELSEDGSLHSWVAAQESLGSEGSIDNAEEGDKGELVHL